MPPRKTSPNTPRRNIKPLAAAPSSVESSTMPSISQQGGELSPTNPRKRRASGQQIAAAQPSPIAPAPAPTAPPSFLSDPQFGDAGPFGDATGSFVDPPPPQFGDPPTQAGTTATTATTDQAASGTTAASATPAAPPAKKTRTNTPWTPAEEQRLKAMRDAGNTWSEIAKTFPTRTEGSVKKHWYKDMHYAEFAEDESAALLAAIKEYEANKWKVIGQKVNKPAKACEQYAKEHFSGKM